MKISILKNPRCSIKLLEEIAVNNYDNPKIIEMVINNKNCSKNLKEFLEELNNS